MRALVFCLVIGGCNADQAEWSESPLFELRVYSSPYETVDWSNDARLMAQHHDHIGASTTAILAYDAAGYDVVSLMDYSGDIGMRDSLRQRLWPVSQWVPSSLLPSLQHIKVFIPNGEESGLPMRPGEQLKHATSPFLETYIEGASTYGAAPSPTQYGSMEELFGRIRQFGGIPCVAHPWNYRYQEMKLGASYCVEIYNALAEALRELNVPYYAGVDRNKTILDHWDGALMANQRVFAIAVNDHFGPQSRAPISNRVRDSGKIVVLAKAATLDSYRQAFSAGSFFAVRDLGAIKNRYPTIFSIDVQDELIFIETAGAVRWIANGEIIGTGPMLLYRDLSYGTTYVRAEVANDEGSTVYTQAFSVRPRGDVNGDYQIDLADRSLCSDLAARDLVQRRACDARAVQQ